MSYKYKVLPISDLIPYINNSRTHSDEQINQIASSIKEFGFTNPILIDEQGGIIAGHGRLMAAQKLSIDKLPTITLDGLTESQKKAYIIADNQLALNAGWDMEILKLELATLTELDFDLDLLGFEDDFLAMLETDPLEDELKYLEDANSSYNFVIKCDDLEQFEEVQSILKAESKIKGEDFKYAWFNSRSN